MGEMLSRFVYGIYVLGTAAGGVINAMIASWVSQVSGDPPLVAAAVRHDRFSHKLLAEGGAFTLALLRKDQADVMPLLKGKKTIAAGRMNGVPYLLAENGAPVPADCAGYIEADIESQYDLGDHTVFVGRVTHEVQVSDGQGLAISDLSGHVYSG